MDDKDIESPLSLTDGRVPRLAALVREALAVLAAILVAFALDAWWDARVERGSMLDALDAVAVEVERNLVRLDEAMAYNAGRSERVNAMASLSLADVEAMSHEQLGTFADLPNYSLATLELGAVTAFIEGGFLAILDERELRAELAGLPRLQVELDEEASVVLSASERMNEVLVALTPMEEFLAPEGPNSPAVTRNILRTFTSTEEARRALLARTFFLTYLYGGELRATRERLEAIGGRIRAYMDGR
jgi:hypothetical protein